MDPDIKKNLSDLSKIPQKEFEKHFSDWMARDDVARSLQAKLRSDLIKNFNKTHLGKQILSQTTNTTGIYGAPTQRLTLSTLVLALNTLVAEFLYAQNCHFSLSVFCTEIPFRNTLPDFESSRCFRFTEPEVVDIFKAISGDANVRKDLRNRIAKDYVGNPTSSLLLLILKNLLELQKQPTVTQGTATDAPEAAHKPLPSKPANQDAASAEHAARNDVKGEIYNTNFRYLNKYLIVLSKKVKEMTQKIENLQQRNIEHDPMHAGTRPRGLTLPRPRSQKSMRRRKYENLNRSLERITENLKQMSLSKRKSKRVTTIVTAIDAMSKQFEKCAANFEQVSKNIFKGTEPRVANNAQPTVAAVPEKTYANWVHEMRTTRNGEKFLNRIEISLSKALRKQKQQLQTESELKLRHQKELLKIRYKQKLMNHLNKFAGHEPQSEVYLEKQNESIEKQLKLFETKHYELLSKIRVAQQNALHNAANNIGTEPETSRDQVKESKLPVIGDGREQLNNDSPAPSDPKPDHNPNSKELQNQRRRQLAFEDAIKTQRKWQEMFKRTTIEDQHVEHIVCDAKMRIRELENESNQLEQSFRNYLERQRLLKEASREAAEKMWNNYTMEKSKIEQKYHLVKENIRRHEKRRRRRRRSLENSDTENESDENLEQRHNRLISGLNVELCRVETGKNAEDVKSNGPAARPIVFRNAILEARDKLFDNESKLKSFRSLQLPEITNMGVNEYEAPSNYLRPQVLQYIPYETPDMVNRMANVVLNSTFSEINIQDQTLEQDFEISSNSSDSLSGRQKDDQVDEPEQELIANYKQSQQFDGIEEQQQLIATSYHKAGKVFKLFDERIKKPHKRGIQAKPNENKENLQQQQNQTKPSTTIEPACQLEGVPNDTMAMTTIKSKAVPTSLVLQQSMAKMNKLFGEEQQELRATRRENKEAAITTKPTRTLRRQQQQQQSNMLVNVIPSIDAVVVVDVAAGTAATRHSIDTSASKKTENKNFNEIEKNNSTQTIIESMATLKRTTTTEQLLATKSKQEMHNINNDNEAQVFNVDNARADGNKGQEQQQMSQHIAIVGQLGVTSNTSSNTSSSRCNTQQSEPKMWMGRHVNDQQLEVGEIIDASSAAAVATTQLIDDKLDVAISVASSSTATSFDLQLSTGGGRGADDAADKSSASEFWE